MPDELRGKVAIVTGGANGLGRATVELFVEEGAKVVIADVDEKRGSQVSAALGAATRFKLTDVSQRSAVQSLVDFAVAEFGGLHVMFNNAGMSDLSYGRLLDDDFSRFERVMNVNMLGVMLGTQIAARHMATHGGGSIINTASIAGIKAGHGFPVYRAAKAGVIHFTKAAAIELGGQLVRVNCICPGNIQTQMGTFATPPEGMTQAAADAMQRTIAAVRMKYQPLQRQGSPRDIANAALFLGSDRSAQVTGQILAVDGGAATGDSVSQIQQIMDAREASLRGARVTPSAKV
ncbi:MAG: SDR family oxidoreductase [Sinobacteraceae bacterium]|nr:SDR family oxidoreductase [Nevskiaceae bacterium]